MRDRKIFRCNACGDDAVEPTGSENLLDCCGRSRIKLTIGNADASVEKHVPVLKQADGKWVVRVGKTEHPMAEDHYIDWIGLELDGALHSVTRKPGDRPVAEFDPRLFENKGADAEKGEHKKIRIYAHCNLHGLWKAEA